MLAAVALVPLTASCSDDPATADDRVQVVTSAGFLADLTRNITGDRAEVTSLIPPTADPHVFQPTPSDLRRVAGADLVVLNGAGLEEGLGDLVREAAGDAPVVEAAEGLTPRTPKPGEPAHRDDHDDEEGETEADPHFWLDPTLAARYVATIRDALLQADPDGAAVYRRNAARYTEELEELDGWIAAQIDTIALADRLLVMNHVSHGYYADRYGLTIVGAVIPGVSTGDTPSARDLAGLTAVIRASGVKAIFVDVGEDPSLSRQLARETGISVIDDLRDHALTEPGGGQATYLEMMRATTLRMVQALR
jgi:ABC-type Zn uptake system ZnuABC Zn-binding protein ZnuA